MGYPPQGPPQGPFGQYPQGGYPPQQGYPQQPQQGYPQQGQQFTPPGQQQFAPPQGGQQFGGAEYNFADIYGRADLSAATLYDAGKYDAVVESAEWGRSKDGSKGQWTVVFRTTSGVGPGAPDAKTGRSKLTVTISISPTKNDGTENSAGLGIMVKQLHALGIPMGPPLDPASTPFWVQGWTEQQVAQAMVGKPALISVVQDEYEGVTRNKVKQILPPRPGANTNWQQFAQQPQGAPQQPFQAAPQQGQQFPYGAPAPQPGPQAPGPWQPPQPPQQGFEGQGYGQPPQQFQQGPGSPGQPAPGMGQAPGGYPAPGPGVPGYAQPAQPGQPGLDQFTQQGQGIQPGTHPGHDQQPPWQGGYQQGQQQMPYQQNGQPGQPAPQQGGQPQPGGDAPQMPPWA